MVSKSEQGKKNRAAGLRFEKKVRKHLEEQGWIVSKWQNNVEFGRYEMEKLEIETIPEGKKFKPQILNKKGKCVPAKPGIFRMMQAGFPDFIVYVQVMLKEVAISNIGNSNIGNENFIEDNPWMIIFIECKSNGYLTKEEKEKAKWYLENNYCSKFLVAKKGKKRGEIEFKEIE